MAELVVIPAAYELKHLLGKGHRIHVLSSVVRFSFTPWLPRAALPRKSPRPIGRSSVEFASARSATCRSIGL